MHRKMTQKSQREAGQLGRSLTGSASKGKKSSKAILSQGGIDNETNLKKSTGKALAMGVPGPRNLLDPLEYEAQGGDLSNFRSEKPAGLVGAADLGMLNGDLMGGLEGNKGDIMQSSISLSEY